MARLDVFVCDKCGKQTVNTGGAYAGCAEWRIVRFTSVLIDKLQDTSEDILVCPNCVRAIREPYPKEASPKSL
jgi:predicted ATP-dependent serine protease